MVSDGPLGQTVSDSLVQAALESKQKKHGPGIPSAFVRSNGPGFHLQGRIDRVPLG